MQLPVDVRYSVNHQFLKSNSPATVFMSIEIHSLKNSEYSSKISNLSLVVDCSSSMRGEKLKQAKKSALGIIRITWRKRLPVCYYFS